MTSIASESVELTAPKSQTLPQMVVVTLGVLVTILLAPTLHPGAAVALSAAAATGLFIAMRNVSTRWVATESGLEFSGLVFVYSVAADHIRGVVLNTQQNVLRVQTEGRTGRSIPLGTSVATATSLARGKSAGSAMASMWGATYTESAASGLVDPAAITRVPSRQTRRLRNGPALYIALAVWLVPSVTSLVN